MEAAQALMKYKAKLQAKLQPKMQPKMQPKLPEKIPILHTTQRELEWFTRLCPNFNSNNSIIHIIKR